MAAELTEFIDCTEHGEQGVVKHAESEDHWREVTLACGCKLSFYRCAIGDAVLLDGELFRVVWVGPGSAFDELKLRNIETTFHIESYSVQYVARDTLSTENFGHQMAWPTHPSFYGPSGGPSRYFPGNSPQRPQDFELKPEAPKPQRKRTSISTADLIKDEVKQLNRKEKQEPTQAPLVDRKPVGDMAEAVIDETPDEHRPQVVEEDIPHREGDW